jgi:predicted GIY-YIG superfamily endonuclease
MPETSGPAAGDGTVYLLHLDPPLKHARHYTGWTSDLDARMEAHRSGRGARLMEVVKEAGGSFRLVRTWPGGRALERAIKLRKEAPKLCPECTPQPKPTLAGRSSPARPHPEATTQAEPGTAPEPETVEDHLQRLRPRPVAPEVYDELMPLTDRLIDGWRAQLDSAIPPPEAEAELELEPLPPAGQPVPVPHRTPARRNSRWASSAAGPNPARTPPPLAGGSTTSLSPGS